MITDSQIKATIKSVRAKKSRIELRDHGDRGSGRLTLVVRSFRTQVTCEWYALYYRDGKRRFTKLGVYPMLSLVDARKQFRKEYAPTILAGSQPDSRFARAQHRKTPDISVRGLFTAYVEHLKGSGKGAWYQVERVLLKRKDNVAAFLGPDRSARSIEPKTIVSYLAAIHAGGKIGMAHNARAYISAAFAFGMKSEHSYTRQNGGGRWGIKANPVAAIPTDAQALRVGDRFLTPTEFRLFWVWLEANRERSASARALQLMMATGQRVREILCLTEAHYDRQEYLLNWKITKNGLPHSLPLPEIAIEILDDLVANDGGYFSLIVWIHSGPRYIPRQTSSVSCMPAKLRLNDLPRAIFAEHGRPLLAARGSPKRCEIACKIISARVMFRHVTTTGMITSMNVEQR